MGDVADAMHIHEHMIVADFVNGAFELADHRKGPPRRISSQAPLTAPKLQR
jgi:hypothetical protein